MQIWLVIQTSVTDNGVERYWVFSNPADAEAFIDDHYEDLFGFGHELAKIGPLTLDGTDV